MLHNPDELWVRILKGKYFPRDNPLHKHRTYQISWIWNSIRRGLHIVKQNIIWEIGIGSTVSISQDNWIPGVGFLHDSHNTGFRKVGDLMNSVGDWDNTKLNANFDPVIVSKIKSIHINKSKPDNLRWLGTTNSEFSTRSAYQILSGVNANNQDPIWQKLWKIQSIPRVKNFVWKKWLLMGFL